MKYSGGKIMYKYLSILFILFLIFGFAGSNVLAQPGIGMGPMGNGHMMESISSEYEFLIKMIPHHEEAVYTAKILKEKTNRQEMKEFAEKIIKTQSREIEQMKGWIDKWYADWDNDYEYQAMMGDYENIEGEQLDQVFLQDMIFHHMSAVMMSQQLIVNGLAQHEEVYELALSIRNNQRNEIFQMREWLGTWY
jgi:uncharacterized protein (DUF305 family)